MIAVTGATGHLGNVLVRGLLEHGHTVRCVVASPDELDDVSLSGLNVERTVADVRNIAALEHALRGADQVFHLAAIIALVPGRERDMEEVNVDGTRHVIEACRKLGVRRLIYTSSIHAFDVSLSGVIVCEDTPITGESALGTYGKMKALATLAVLDAAKHGLNAVVACPTGIVGPYDYRLSPIARVLLAYMHGRAWFDLPGEYDFVDVRDVADGLLRAAERGRTGETYLLSGEVAGVHRIYQLLAEMTMIPAPTLKLSRQILKFLGHIGTLYGRLSHREPILNDESVQILFSNSAVCGRKAELELGFMHRPLIDSLRDTVSWLSENEQALLRRRGRT
jgi:dihydroflavonol-4-reductase